MSLPKLLQKREEGRVIPTDFTRIALYGDHSTWRLSHKHQVHAAFLQGRATTTTTSLDLATRFLLSGSSNGDVSIHDVWTSNNNNNKGPIQWAKTPRDHSSITSVQWYPVDTGVFFTGSAAGSVCLWDTNKMEVVLSSKPFEYTESSSSYALRCMKVSPFSLLAAVGSNGSSTVKLMDLKSGATSHSLSCSDCHSGVTSVCWSPTNSNMLVSCSGKVVLFDIRRPNCVLATLNEDDRVRDPNVSTAYHFDGSHFLRKGKKIRKTAKNTATNTTATNVSFDATGRHLVTVCGKSRNVSVWDLRFSPKPIRQFRNFVSEYSGKPVEKNNRIQPLLVTGERQEQIVWVTRERRWVGYPLLDDKDSHGRPAFILSGHLGKIQAATSHSHLMVTSAVDSLTLVWERGKVETKRPLRDVDDW